MFGASGWLTVQRVVAGVFCGLLLGLVLSWAASIALGAGVAAGFRPTGSPIHHHWMGPEGRGPWSIHRPRYGPGGPVPSPAPSPPSSP
jgi:hypothetical protein